MLSQMASINRASRAANLIVKTQKGLAHANKTGPNVGNRIRGYLQSDKTSVRELVEIYHHLAVQTTQSSLYSLTEEKLLTLLTPEKEEDDMVSKYIPKIYLYDYNSLCNLFVEISSVGRRPTPLIRAASNVLAQIPLPHDETRPRISTLISTLNALVRLNYRSRTLVTKIISDLTEIINLNEIDSNLQCNLLRTIGGLKWCHEPLMQMFYDYAIAHGKDTKRITSNLLVALFYVTATINFKPTVDIKEFYQSLMAGAREDSIDRKSRKWLNYVWSLSLLDIADDRLIMSVLDEEFIAGIENPVGLQRFNYGDVMKLLNLRAISRLEKRIGGTGNKLLDELAQQKIQRGSDLERFSARMKLSLNGLVRSSRELRHDIHTPYGFAIDCEALLNKNKEFIPLDSRTTLEDELSLAEKLTRSCDTDEIKCAIIYVLFDEAIANHPDEPVGHKRVIARILRSAGYRTVFLQESVLNREKTSSDLASAIMEKIVSALTDDDSRGQVSE